MAIDNALPSNLHPIPTCVADGFRARNSRAVGLVTAVAVAALLHGCASTPGGSSGSRPSGRDGAPTQPRLDLEQVPDAVPRVETMRTGGPNKPYTVLGRWYTPRVGDGAFEERGLASWYGTKFHGQPTSSGEPYDMYAMTAAHPTMPIPSYARVRNPANGREIIVRINDRGPFHPGRVIDLSYTGAYKLGLLRGVAPVELERITYEEIRADNWRRTPAQEATRLARNAPPVQVAALPLLPSATPAQQPAQAVALVATQSAPQPQPPLQPPPPEAEPTSDVAVPTPVFSSPESPPTELVLAQQPQAPTAPAEVTAAPVTTAAAAPAPARTQQPAADQPSRFWVQLGAFRQSLGAETLQRRTLAQVDWIAPLLSIFNDSPLYRVQAGPFVSQDEAVSAARRIGAAMSMIPVIVERR
ncbi:hypothetical protein BH09PSE5_BH09PSE5_40740 [soil metagenome]